jgi:uncharacterized membrane protein
LALTFFVFEKKRHSLKELVNFSQFLSKKTQKMKTLALLVLKQLVLDLSFSSFCHQALTQGISNFTSELKF